mgnify:FL=1
MTTQAQVTECYNSVISSFKSGLVKNPKLTLKDQVKKSHIEPNSFFLWFKEEGFDARRIKTDVLREQRNLRKKAEQEASAKKKLAAKQQYIKNSSVDRVYRHKVVEKAKEYEQLMINFLKKKYENICNLAWNDIEDAIGDVYYRLLVEPSTLKIDLSDEGRFRALLCTKARQSMMNLRKQKKETECKVVDLGAWYKLPTPANAIQMIEVEHLQNLLDEAISTMPEEVQGMLTLHYQGATEREAVRELNIKNIDYRRALEEFTEKTRAYVSERMPWE